MLTDPSNQSDHRTNRIDQISRIHKRQWQASTEPTRAERQLSRGVTDMLLNIRTSCLTFEHLDEREHVAARDNELHIFIDFHNSNIYIYGYISVYICR